MYSKDKEIAGAFKRETVTYLTWEVCCVVYKHALSSKGKAALWICFTRAFFLLSTTSLPQIPFLIKDTSYYLKKYMIFTSFQSTWND